MCIRTNKMSAFCCLIDFGSLESKVGKLYTLCIQLLLRTLFDLQNKQDILQRSGKQRGTVHVFHLTLHQMFSHMSPSIRQKSQLHLCHPKPGVLFSQKPQENHTKNQFIFSENSFSLFPYFLQTRRKSLLLFPCVETHIYLKENHFLEEFIQGSTSKGFISGVENESKCGEGVKRRGGREGRGGRRTVRKGRGGGEQRKDYKEISFPC